MDDFWSNDGKTSYIFTSALSSSHANPMVIWGSGISRGEIQCDQVDLAPLVSTLLDLKFPAQNQGQVPDKILNMSHDGIIKAKVANGLQMHEQVVRFQDFYQSLMTSQAYQGLDIQSVLSIVGRITQLQKNFAFQAASDLANDLLKLCSKGIQYCLTFNSNMIALSFTISFVLWLGQLVSCISNKTEQAPGWSSRSIGVLVIGTLLVLVYGHFWIWLPWSHIGYLMIPIYFCATFINVYSLKMGQQLIYNDILEYVFKDVFSIFLIINLKTIRLLKNLVLGLIMVELICVSLHVKYLITIPMTTLTIMIMLTMTRSSSVMSKLELIAVTALLSAFPTFLEHWPSSVIISLVSSIVLAFLLHFKSESGSRISLAITISYLLLGGACGHFLTAYQNYFVGMIFVTAIPVSLIITPNDQISRTTSLSFILTSMTLCKESHTDFSMMCSLLIAFMFIWLSMASKMEANPLTKTSTTSMGSTEALIAIGTLTLTFASFSISPINYSMFMLIPMIIISLFSVSLVKVINGQVDMFFRYVIFFSGLYSLQVYIWTYHVGPFNDGNFSSFAFCQFTAIFLPFMLKVMTYLMMM